jgi:two-component system OmpR family response regulator
MYLQTVRVTVRGSAEDNTGGGLPMGTSVSTNGHSSSAVGALPHVLVVDDDAEISALVRRYLAPQGFRISTAANGGELREVLRAGHVDLILLDLGLPGEDGLELTRYLHSHWQGPVIIVSGRGESVDRVVGLELGADDYVTKPFDLRELLARVRSVLRRSARSKESASSEKHATLVFRDYRLDTASHVLRSPAGDEVPLTSGEYDLLKLFLEYPQKVLSRNDIMTHIHGRDAGPFDRAIDVQIGRLRRKIEVGNTQPSLIRAIRGTGYMFAEQVRRE